MTQKETLHLNERVAVIETKLEDVQKDIADIKATLNDFVQSADQRYASKQVERDFNKIKNGGVFVVGLILLALLALVLNHVWPELRIR